MPTLILLRHGQSQWNLENRFTGWTDVDLTQGGEREARDAAQLLRRDGFAFDIAYSSMLRRAIRTLWVDSIAPALDAALRPLKHYYLGDRAAAV